jgi:hypothetical protein
MANLIGLKQHPMAMVRGKDGKVVMVPTKMPEKQKRFLEKKFEEHINYEKRLKNS